MPEFASDFGEARTMQTIGRNTLLGGIAALVLAAGTAHGQTTTGETTLPGDTPAQTTTTGPAADLTLPAERGQLHEGVGELRTEDLEGMNVYSIEGQEIGEVEGLVLNEGAPHLVVSLGTGWFNWGGGDRVAIPAENFERSEDGLTVQLTDAQAAALEEYVSEIDPEQMTRYETIGDAYTVRE
jgi:sporulation protein YlmC with PRC-barrel domain